MTIRNKWVIILCTVLILFILYMLYISGLEKPGIVLSPYPYGKNFAFSITDDPDNNRLKQIKPIYDFFDKIGIKTTMAVWVRRATRSNGMPDIEGDFDFGDTCQNERYLSYITALHNKGFEIALHTISGGNDKRIDTIEGYEEFKRLFGEYPKINIMHAENLENIYWGSKVIKNSALRMLLETLSPKAKLPFSGDESSSPYFWGDILQSKTKYVRMMGTGDINTLKFNPSMPYHDPQKPYVNYWFSFSDGSSCKIFNELISHKNVETLSQERGTCIVYTHLVNGFTSKNSNGKRILNAEFERKMRSLASRESGWFMPASIILDRLLAINNIIVIEDNNRVCLFNSNDFDVAGLTILVEPESIYRTDNGDIYQANHEGEIIIDKIIGKQGVNLYTDLMKNPQLNSFPKLSTWEYSKMVYERAKLYIKHRIIKTIYNS